MAELVARGPNPEDQEKWTLSDGSAVTLGRVPSKCDMGVPWDPRISGTHASLVWDDGVLCVRRLEASVNAVRREGKDQGFEEFLVSPGQSFSIGSTTFTVSEEDAGRPSPNFQSSATLASLHQARYTDPDKRIEILASLPELIRFSPSDKELETRVAEVLVQGVAHAVVAGVVRLTTAEGAEPEVEVRASATRARRAA